MMKLCEVVSDAYVDEIIARNHLPDYLCAHGPSWKWNIRRRKRVFVISYVNGNIHCVIQQLTP
jgi:hypothetical protein